MGNTIRDFFEDESGVGVVEVILILVVLIGLVLIFKNQLIQFVKNIFGQINHSATDVY